MINLLEVWICLFKSFYSIKYFKRHTVNTNLSGEWEKEKGYNGVNLKGWYLCRSYLQL
jgi:hypothetical protein